jgi:hypothetical protein
MTEEQLTALLRLKRHEQPPAEYFDRLLEDIHRRQRTELLRQPLWRIATERMQTFFSEHSMGHISYAGALAVALVGGITVIGLMTPSGGVKTGSESRSGIASTTAWLMHWGTQHWKGGDKSESQLASAAASPSQDTLLHLQKASLPRLDPQPLPAPRSALQFAGHEPRYVIDARPVSYEPSSSFNF